MNITKLHNQILLIIALACFITLITGNDDYMWAGAVATAVLMPKIKPPQ